MVPYALKTYTVGSEDTMETGQMDSWPGHQGNQPGDKIQWNADLDNAVCGQFVINRWGNTKFNICRILAKWALYYLVSYFSQHLDKRCKLFITGVNLNPIRPRKR